MILIEFNLIKLRCPRLQYNSSTATMTLFFLDWISKMCRSLGKVESKSKIAGLMIQESPYIGKAEFLCIICIS
jgi:hypothetical protein